VPSTSIDAACTGHTASLAGEAADQSQLTYAQSLSFGHVKCSLRQNYFCLVCVGAFLSPNTIMNRLAVLGTLGSAPQGEQ
jgi:hypothetical protein